MHPPSTCCIGLNGERTPTAFKLVQVDKQKCLRKGKEQSRLQQENDPFACAFSPCLSHSAGRIQAGGPSMLPTHQGTVKTLSISLHLLSRLSPSLVEGELGHCLSTCEHTTQTAPSPPGCPSRSPVWLSAPSRVFVVLSGPWEEHLTLPQPKYSRYTFGFLSTPLPVILTLASFSEQLCCRGSNL